MKASIDRFTRVEDLPELLRVSEAARWLDESEWTIYDLARRGVLPSVRLGRSVRIPRRGLAALLALEGDDGQHGQHEQHDGEGC